jgi:hypothetical protein
VSGNRTGAGLAPNLGANYVHNLANLRELGFQVGSNTIYNDDLHAPYFNPTLSTRHRRAARGRTSLQVQFELFKFRCAHDWWKGCR